MDNHGFVAIYLVKFVSKGISKMKFGIYRLQEVLDTVGINSIEKGYGISISVISVYRAWNQCRIEDDLSWLDNIKRASRDILLTWEPWKLVERSGPSWDQPAFSLNRILSGHYDNYIRAFAEQLALFTQTVYLRPMHEMNGNWYPWCGCVNGNRVDQFVPAWQYIRNLVQLYVGPNVHWVWSPYATSYPAESYNDIHHYFPGRQYVDWLAMDGYNWGTCNNKNDWQSFEKLFHSAYSTLIKLANLPLMIAETACSEEGGDKASWIINASKELNTAFKRVQLIVWFDTHKECDWRIASSSAALKAFRRFGQLS